MIKFIAADMDGTLLNSKKELPKDFVEVIAKLKEKQIVFAPASGRQYQTLYDMFSPISPDFIYIAENGSMVVRDGKPLVCDCIDGDVVREVVETVRKIPTAYVLLCCDDCAYGENGDDEIFSRNVSLYYHSYQNVDDLIPLCYEKNVLKLAIYDREDAGKNVYHKIPNYPEQIEAILSAKDWVDVMKADVSKGGAIKRLQEIYGWKPEECMCFGDYLNDYEMFLNCSESYAMANAHEKLKEAAKYIAPSNDEDGVMKMIESKLL